MEYKLKCRVCRRVFYGQKDRLYCCKDCSLKARRKRRAEKDKKSAEEKRKDSNRRYYLKNKHLLTKKYKEEQQEFLLEQKKKKQKEKEAGKNWKKNNKEKACEYRRKTRITGIKFAFECLPNILVPFLVGCSLELFV